MGLQVGTMTPMIASRPDALTALRRLRRAAADRACRDVGPLSPSAWAEWVYGEEDVAHRSGGFFRVIGLTYSLQPAQVVA
mgnify:CR=1 FL=1